MLREVLSALTTDGDDTGPDDGYSMVAFVNGISIGIDYERKFDSIFAGQLFTYLHFDTSDLDLNIIHLSSAHDFRQAAFVMLNDSEIKANLEEAAGLNFIPLGNYLA